MRTVRYKGFQASVQFDDNALFIKVLHIDDLLIAEVDKASEVQKEFESLIDAYIQDCKELGREPTKPFKGSFNVRVTPEQHRLVAMRAADEGITLNKWVSAAIDEKLECGKLSERIDGVFAKQKEEMHFDVLAKWISQNIQVSNKFEKLPEINWVNANFAWSEDSGRGSEDLLRSLVVAQRAGKSLHA